MRREYRLTEVVKQYDPSLFVKRDETGKMHLIRKTTRVETVIFDGVPVLYSRPDYRHIFSLTDTWQPQGTAVDMGIEPLMARIREIDTHRSEEIIDRVNQAAEECELENARDLKNKSQAFSEDLRHAVKSDFADYNLASYKSVDTREKYQHRIEKEGL